MQIKLIILSIIAFSLFSCASTLLPRKEINNLTYECSNVNQQIAYLQRKKTYAPSRIASGIRSIIPITMIVGIIQGTYIDTAMVATGHWDKHINKKINTMKEFKESCDNSLVNSQQ